MTPTIEQATSNLFTFATAIIKRGKAQAQTDIIDDVWKNSPGTRREEWEELFDAEFPEKVA